MTLQLHLTPAAESDLDAAYTWYELQRTGLGVRFLGAVDQFFAKLSESPAVFPEIAPGFRRGLLRRFPYGIYFAIETHAVVVHAVFHLHRNPDVVQTRRPGGGSGSRP
ncbi:MAG: type II toxin-antitoxin system RelE/ParE family toxin [Planctomycetes bacterium]|nr:type II toxin-antitoxin system RelE/ParE family toxin [Planctomycetota bacterium]